MTLHCDFCLKGLRPREAFVQVDYREVNRAMEGCPHIDHEPGIFQLTAASMEQWERRLAASPPHQTMESPAAWRLACSQCPEDGSEGFWLYHFKAEELLRTEGHTMFDHLAEKVWWEHTSGLEKIARVIADESSK